MNFTKKHGELDFHDFNEKGENLHQTLRFKAKKVTPNQLFRGKSLLAPKAGFKRESSFPLPKVQNYTFWVKSAKFMKMIPKRAKKK